MADLEWRIRFPHALVELLQPHGSDHNPLLLSCLKCQSPRNKIFHFQAAWTHHPDYEAVVDNTWSHTLGCTLHKLHQVREQSIIFNKDVFGNIFRRKRHLQARIKGVHNQLDRYPYADLISLEKDLQNQYNQVLIEEELLWYQKSREKWVKFGNKNTRFFHTQTVIRRRRNMIFWLNIDGIWCTDEEVLKKEALLFFKNLFVSSDHCDPQSLQLSYVPQIDPDLYSNLLAPVSMEEVKNALFSMGPYKAPGVDGFQPIFYRTYWHIVGHDVWQLVANAFGTGKIMEQLAETLIVPIPKVDTPDSFKDFRPISLCNVLLKLISKVLVMRIRPAPFLGLLYWSLTKQLHP